MELNRLVNSMHVEVGQHHLKVYTRNPELQQLPDTEEMLDRLGLKFAGSGTSL